jgi:hypothetical protein
MAEPGRARPVETLGPALRGHVEGKLAVLRLRLAAEEAALPVRGDASCVARNFHEPFLVAFLQARSQRVTGMREDGACFSRTQLKQ